MVDEKQRAVVSINSNISQTEYGGLWTLLQPEGCKNVPIWVIGQKIESITGYDITFTKINYDKQVYRPGEATLAFTVALGAGQSTIALSNVLKQTYLDKMFYVDVVGFKGPAQVSSLTEMNNKVYIAKNYYIHSISVGRNPEKASDQTSCQYMLKCYSLDKKLTLDRYCDVYVGKRVSTDICENGVLPRIFGTYEKELLSPTGKTKQLYDCASGRLLFLGYTVGCGKNPTDGGRTKKVNNGKIIPHPNELKQPYLVQYNESFYDFISRVLHRCGEFLYFENGQFCIGLPEQTIEVLDKVDAKNHGEEIKESVFCEYSEISLSEKQGQEVQAFSRHYIDAKENTAIDQNKSYYDAYMSSDEDLRLLKGDDASRDDFGAWLVYTFLDTFFKSDSLLSGLVSAAYSLVENGIMYGALKSGVEKKLKNDYIYRKEEKEDKSTKKKITEEYNIPDSTLGVNLADNICNSLYRQVEQWEEISGKKSVKISFSTNLPKLYLAQAIYLKGGVDEDYVITRMSGEVTASTTSNSAEAVPIIKGALPGYMGGIKGVVLPPPGISGVPGNPRIPHILKSSAMEAVVVKNDDPLRVGRVKVKYPWQKEADPRSPWIRVTVPYAGSIDKDSGFLMIPDEGEHVMLDYIGGNIERPFVNGSVYYVGNRPTIGDKSPDAPLYWPARKIRTIASGNGHNITFFDGANTNFLEAVFPPLRPILTAAGAGQNGIGLKTGTQKTVGGDNAFLGVKGGKIVIGDGSAMCSVGIYPGPRKVAIDSRFGSVTIDAFTGISLSSPNGDINISAKNINIKAGNNITIQSGTNIDRNPEDGSYKFGLYAGLVLGNALKTVSKKVLGVDFDKCFDFTFLRCVVDSLLRPVEGTLSLRSNRNTILTAGSGDVTIPNNYLARTYINEYKWVTVESVDFAVLSSEKKRYNEYMRSKDDGYFEDMLNVLTVTAHEVDGYFDDLSNLISKTETLLNDMCGMMLLAAEFIDGNKCDDILNRSDDFLKRVLVTVEVSVGGDGKFKGDTQLEEYFLEGKDRKQRLVKERLVGFVNELKKVTDGLLKLKEGKENSLKSRLKKLVEVGGKLTSNPLVSTDTFDTLTWDLVYDANDKIGLFFVKKGVVEVKVEVLDIVKSLADIMLHLSENRVRFKRLVILYCIFGIWEKDKQRFTIPKIKKDNNKGGIFVKDADLGAKECFGNMIGDHAIIKDNSAWDAFVHNLPESGKKKIEGSFKKSFGSSILSSFGSIYEYKKGKETYFGDFGKIANWGGKYGPRTYLPSSGAGGGSLFISNDGGYVTKLNDEGTGWDSIANPSVKSVSDFLKNL